MQRLLRIFSRLLLVVLILVLLAGAAGYLYLRRSLPQVDGTIKVAGLRGPVEIIRDIDAVPHIYAEHTLDLFFGLGYVHAQERMWQMEFQRRVGQGRLAEILGPGALPTDRFLRTLGVHRAARSAYESLSPESREVLDAYAAGVNAFLAGHSGSRLQPEFTILGVQPEPWTGPDSLAWAKMMALDLGGNYALELLRSDLIAAVGPERAQQLLPGYPEDGPSILPSLERSEGYEQLAELGEQVRQLAGFGRHSGDVVGSNNWVVDGTKSVTGKPVLANDPHLGSRIPSLWYLAHLSSGDYEAIGATLPGIPGVVIGRNRFIAWGVTNVNPDVQDLFRERLDATGTLAEFQGRMEPMQIITETIKVKGQPDVQHVVRITRHGPLISDAINANNESRPVEERPAPLEPLAFRWTALDAEDTTIDAFLEINQARNWEEFTEALRSYVAPSQNFVYADVEGNIGYYIPGRVPIRSAGDGLLPAEGWSGNYEWVGWIPFEELPHIYNPAQHFIATANNRPVPAGYPHFLGRDWAPPYRAQRIVELLQAREQLSIDDHKTIQGDSVSLLARDLLADLLPLLEPQSDDERRAVELLKNWDYETRGESAAAAIFEMWYLHLLRGLLDDELGPKLRERYESRSQATLFMSSVLEDPASPWCDNTTTAEQEDCAALALATLRAALDELKARLGSDMASWRWDQLHIAVFPHQPFDNVGLLKRLFSRSIPNGGDSSTVNVAPFSFKHPFEQRTIPSYRQIIDMANPDGGLFIHSVGQSGHILSSHYADYLDDWRELRYVPMRMERVTVERDKASVLRLEP